MNTLKFICALQMLVTPAAFAQSTYTPPAASAAEVAGINFDAGLPLTALHTRLSLCDRSDFCGTKKLKSPYRCSSDPSANTVLLKLRDGVLFYDAKMAIDADGAALSKSRTGTDLPETSWHYPTAPGSSVDAEHVPYIVLPEELVLEKHKALRPGVTVNTGDIAAVVYKGRTRYALVADTGPACKLGEGSMKLHDELGNKACVKFGPDGVCTIASNTGIPRDVLFFVFPDSASLISEGLTPANVNGRINRFGPLLMQRLRNGQSQSLVRCTVAGCV